MIHKQDMNDDYSIREDTLYFMPNNCILPARCVIDAQGLLKKLLVTWFYVVYAIFELTV